jgi:hypothetical protein
MSAIEISKTSFISSTLIRDPLKIMRPIITTSMCGHITPPQAFPGFFSSRSRVHPLLIKLISLIRGLTS